uniref:Uncharacterized protein n=1 Tax=Anguilla anguilla TaxID=7936 RepID=A0A0E9PKP1_ANGAN
MKTGTKQNLFNLHQLFHPITKPKNENLTTWKSLNRLDKVRSYV